MARTAWHLERTAEGLTLARHWPPRFDLCARARIAGVSASLSLTRLAHQIRQDLWRRLQRLRGFSPVVQITRDGEALDLCVGGRAARPIPSGARQQIVELLEDRAARNRWILWANQGRTT